MKKLINTAFTYMIIGLASGVFYREYTKYTGFSGSTRLSLLHTHVLILGMFFFLIAALFQNQLKMHKHKSYKRFYTFYNLGVISTTIMLLVRGLLDIHVTDLSKGMNAAVSGTAGLSHIVLTIGIFYFFKILRDLAKN